MVELQINDGTEILTRLWNNVLAMDLVPRRLDSSRLGLLLSAIASELNVVTSILQSYANQFIMSTCTDKVLVENMARMFAVRRLASKSKVILKFYRINNYNETVKIPAQFAVRDGLNGKHIFKTISDVYLWKGVESVSVLAYSIGSGSKFNVNANTLTNYQANNFNTKIAVTNPAPAFGGFNDESIEHLKGRASGFRYERDGTYMALARDIFMMGVSDNNWLSIEYYDGPGSYLLCFDTESEEEFEDYKRLMSNNKTAGIKQIFTRVERIYVNIYVNIETTGDTDYSPIQKENIYNNVTETVQRFFAAYCWVGSDLNTVNLKSSLLNALNEYDIGDLTISFDKGISTNKKGVITIEDTQKFYANKIITNLNYKGGV